MLFVIFVKNNLNIGQTACNEAVSAQKHNFCAIDIQFFQARIKLAKRGTLLAVLP